MQLLLLLALLLTDGGENLIKQAQPFLNGDIKDILTHTEELSAIVSALKPEVKPCEKNTLSPGENFPLAPIAAIADDNITYCITKFIAENL